MRNVTIRQRILGSFAIILALMIVMGGVAYVRLMLIEREANDIQTGSMPSLYYSAQIMNALVMNYALVEEFVLENDKAAIAAVDVRVQANETKLEGLLKDYDAIISDPKERENFGAFKILQGPYNRIQETILKLGLDNKDEEAQTLARTQLKPIFDKAQSALQMMNDFNKIKADNSTRQIMAGVDGARTGITISFVVALLISFFTGYYLLRAITGPLARIGTVMNVMRLGDFTQRLAMERRDEFGALADGFNGMTDELTALVGQVQKSGIQVNTSIMEIAATSKEQQATASEISATTTEIGATSKEISATSKELVRTMNEVAAVAEQTATLAGNGQTGLSRMEEMMGHVMEAASSINAKLAVLNEKAGNINQVVTTITKVADQTNLLSLNAAIEAEKAGEYGRGFAVVATEIRRLADQTSVATYDIELMVKEIHSAVSAGVMGMDKFSEEVRRGMQEVQQVGGQLSQIIQQVLTLVPRFETVNEGMQAQATGAEQISDALKQLSEAAQQTVESLRQSSQAIEELNQVSSGLRGSVSRFKLQT